MKTFYSSMQEMTILLLLFHNTMYEQNSGCSSGVERNLAKVDVARSNRVTR